MLRVSDKLFITVLSSLFDLALDLSRKERGNTINKIIDRNIIQDTQPKFTIIRPAIGAKIS